MAQTVLCATRCLRLLPRLISSSLLAIGCRASQNPAPSGLNIRNEDLSDIFGPSLVRIMPPLESGDGCRERVPQICEEESMNLLPRITPMQDLKKNFTR